MEQSLTAFDLEKGDIGVAEADVRLDEVLQEIGDELRDTHDFGDGWTHLLRLDVLRPRSGQDPRPPCRTAAGHARLRTAAALTGTRPCSTSPAEQPGPAP